MSGRISSAMLGQLPVSPVHRLIDSLRRDTARTLLMAAALGWWAGSCSIRWQSCFCWGCDERRRLDAGQLRAVFTEPRLAGRAANSVIVSAATLVSSLVLALPLAWGVARTRMPGKWLVNVAVRSPS